MLQNILTLDFIVALLTAAVRTGVPIALTTIGAIYAERSGILSICLEGEMLMGAFCGFIGMYYSHNLVIGMLCGVLGGMFISFVLAVSAVTLNANQTLTGIALNMFATGATSFGYWLICGVQTTPTFVVKLSNIPIPLLKDIPILGPVFFQHSIVVYLCYILTVMSYIIIFRTTFGLKLRACGEYPRAAETMGVNVRGMRYTTTLISGAMSGLGGAFLTLVLLGMFTDSMTASRGFIALSIVIFGRWNPLAGFGAALFFGLMDGLQLRLQALGFSVPYQFLIMLPYVFTLVAMMFTGRNVKGPAYTGKPYIKEQL